MKAVHKRHILIFAISIFISIISFNNAIAGNYGNKINEITPIFNRAAKNIDPPPPNKFNYDYRPKAFDPPGMHGPSTQLTPPPPPPPSQIKLTPIFNGSAK